MREKNNLLRHLAAGISIPAAAAVSVLALALPASAAPSSGAAPAVTAPSAISARSAAAHVKGSLPAAYYRVSKMGTRTVTTIASPALRARMGAPAGQPCATFTTDQYYNNYLGQTLFNYYQNTYFCWDYNTVTYHSTWESGMIPGWAKAIGWRYDGVVTTGFNCFYATSRWCSGNHEFSQGHFEICISGLCDVEYPYIDQYEYYNGHRTGSGGFG